ncbi:MAG: HAD hydrolase family protein [Coriobacteriales bacterium]|jgi:hydroxymethylpyrimidine pyrophosphatase-like HAD family hydrolase|nr:HAD hydrolase family protein [Coriobacteriales bacterium]
MPDSLNTPVAVTSVAAAARFKAVTHIYTDLDGTLLAPGGRLLASDDGTPSTAVCERLVTLKRAGIEVIAVTGRNRAQGTEIIRLLNLKTLIGELGTFTQDGYGARATSCYDLGDWAKTVLAPRLAPGELPPNTTPAQLIEASGIISRLQTIFAGRLEAHNPYGDSREVTRMLRGYVSAEEAAEVLAREALPLQLSDNGIIHPQQHTLINCPEIHVYHLMPRGTGKGRAVAADMIRRGLSRAQTLAIGDAVGDVEMGAATGSFILVSNASKTAVLEGAAALPLPPAWRLEAIFTTERRTADGWVEFADAFLAARAG